MKKLVLLAAVMVGMPVLAQSPAVDTARATGVAGERYDGYMGFAGPASEQLRSQVAAINIRRRSLYSNLAASRGASPQDVGITAGCTLLARTPIGGSYMLGDGVWRKRAAGQAPPVPDYCR